MKKIFKAFRDRWNSESPKVFQWILRLALGVSGVALAVQTALTAGNAVAPEWWEMVYPYLVGVGAGAAAVAKLTKEQRPHKNNRRKHQQSPDENY